ncbi:MAG: hypothetical protein JNM89_11425 [Hyphomicrobiaceae bacterium]|nr:hypothetical protein [Hyphomicrobiaceae bacterium]
MATFHAGGSKAASSKDDWFNDACPEKTEARWCAPTLRDGGWILKYRTESPKDLEGVFWVIEVWIKGRDALVCEMKGGRSGMRSNGCYSLTEVPAGR